ncbi:MAG: hypothetical protein F4Z51_03135 [Chloroflexi bacterium]|nr:hypothetical protein [Chloroflexota bacterium]MYD15578.1 hypothetical protein [Chloroflexota bacterium]
MVSAVITRVRIAQRASPVATLDFTGEYEHRIDDRGRLAIPAAYRMLFEHSGYLLPGPDGQLELYTPEGYAQEKRTRTANNKLRAEDRRLARGFFGRVRQVDLDRQGRIVIPQPMREQRGLSGDTTIIGMGDYLEIWNSDAWRSEQSEIDDSYAQLLQDLAATLDAADANGRDEESS